MTQPPSPPNALSILDADTLGQIEKMDDPSAYSIEDRIALMSALAGVASAADPDQAERLLLALETAKDRTPAFSIAFELYAAHLALRHEDYELSGRHSELGRRLALHLGREAEAASFCLVRGTIEYRCGRYDLARAHFEEAVVAARRAGTRELESRALMSLGLVLKNSGDLQGAERLLRFARDLAATIAIDANVARCELNLANVLIRRGAWKEAIELSAAAASQLDSIGLIGFANSARLAQGRAMRLLGKARNAHDILVGALDEAKRLDKSRNIVLALEFLGDCEIDLGDLESARERYREALLLARGHGRATDLVVECLRGLAATELACGEPGSARNCVDESIRIAREQGDSFELGTSLLVLATTLAASGDTRGEIEALEEARGLSGVIGDDHGRARASYALALHAVAEGLSMDAITLAAEARRLFLRIGAESAATESLALLGRLSAAPPSVELSPAPSPVRAADPQVPGFLTSDSRVRRALASASTLAPQDLSILILGESGTGKELVAQAIHERSGRKGPFVPVNCSAFPGDLIEGELFGHAKGAYTGADRERVGLFEYAHKGTLFLDEIGDLPLKAQARLLRVLENGEVRRLGENASRTVDVRILAATHRHLMEMVGAGQFRLDLYYRLAGYVVELPPVRERSLDAKLLIDHFVERFSKVQGKSITLSPDLRHELSLHSWPGNVREIKMVMQRLVSLTTSGTIVHKLPFSLDGGPRPRSLPEVLEAEERKRILEALQAHNWNKAKAAITLGTNRTTLIGKMKRMGISLASS